mgnify:CR=1 FL=1
MYISSFIGGYCGPGDIDTVFSNPDLLKRFDLPNDHIGLFFSSDNINFPNDVYDLRFISSVSLKSILYSFILFYYLQLFLAILALFSSIFLNSSNFSFSSISIFKFII